MSKLLTSDADLRHLLENTKTIALVGASPKPNRASHGVMAFLQQAGYRVIPVNPVAAGTTILGETVYGTLAEIGEPIDMVDVFRRLSPSAPNRSGFSWASPAMRPRGSPPRAGWTW
jgi:predicted CoA-binding protein